MWPTATSFLKALISPADQKVTFVELFFDLVFVFAFTQVVGLFHDGVTWSSTGQFVLVFWMVWWAWVQYTWTLNAADTTHSFIEVATLLATGVAFFMAVAAPDAYHGRELAFAVPYVATRVIGLTVYVMVAWADPKMRSAVVIFGATSATGMVAVIAGAAIGGPAQYWCWGGAIALDVLAASIGGRRQGWGLHPEHFSERYALFVIIALGESLIVAAAGLTGATWTGGLITIAVLSVALAGAMWWSYFKRAKAAVEHAMKALVGPSQSTMARDVFSVMHFPMICGVAAFAAAVKEAIAHPEDPLSTGARLALASGVLLFVGGMALAKWRATTQVLIHRVVAVACAAVAVAVTADVQPYVSLLIALAGVVGAIILEQMFTRTEHARDTAPTAASLAERRHDRSL